MPGYENFIARNIQGPDLAQIDRAKAAGLRLTHLDSHMATLFGSRELLALTLGFDLDHGLQRQQRQG